MGLLLFKEEAVFKLGVWHIEEEASFFADRISYRSTATHPGKQTQQLATRFLLKELQADLPLDAIRLDSGGKPFLPDQQLNFNVSHTSRFAAAIISKDYTVGIDTEKIDARVLKIQHKFLNDEEKSFINQFSPHQKIDLLTKYWTIKEAVYKWWGKGEIDFSHDIRIHSIVQDQGPLIVQFIKEGNIELLVESIQLEDHWVSFVVK
jgi:phosphopantetheine--protein transferase-like protein